MRKIHGILVIILWSISLFTILNIRNFVEEENYKLGIVKWRTNITILVIDGITNQSTKYKMYYDYKMLSNN